ncbi:MAG TPA: DNA mismatch repair protein MutS [Gemmatimonadaceae bacterium]
MTRVATPLMQQYQQIKSRHANAILMFRMGDFYEMFFDDAEVASRELGLTLTSRNNGGAADVPLAGVPVKAVSEYLRRLVQKGYRVAICEQVEDPRLAKGLVRREVIETVTPGAAFADDLLEGERHNFLCAIHVGETTVGLAAVDVSTGAFRLVLADRRDAPPALARLGPREVLVRRDDRLVTDLALPLDGVLLTERDGWEFDAALGREELARQFGLHSVDGLGLDSGHEPVIAAAGAVIRYLRELQPAGVPHLMRPTVETTGDTMPLDEMTRRNLELVESLRGGTDARAGTLVGVLDRTRTPMGARLLREWLLAPLVSPSGINRRLDAVAALVANPVARAAAAVELDGVRDVERLAARTAAGRVNPRELRGLGESLIRLQPLGTAITPAGRAGLLADVVDGWDPCTDVASDILQHLVDRPAATLGDGDVFVPGVDRELDGLRALRDGGKDGIAGIQTSERQRTGISSLKVGYNRVFGYFIEVTNANRHLIPSDYQRRQTLTGAERFVTPALKEFEEKVLGATERIDQRERELFENLRQRVAAATPRLQIAAGRVAMIDVLASFAQVAEVEGYCRPVIEDGFDIEITGGRHPVVERMMPRDRFIPNDVRLTNEQRMIILTGPNMAGKSTVLRQVGLIVLMAQAGSCVPATGARIGVVDRLFTRVGASDNLVRGQSTFMVEMAETSAILNMATPRSLVLLDEIGRGTSTYDGVSIAWAVSEHLHDRVGCKTMFATHYHELTQLADELPALRNFNVGVREVDDGIVFLHRMQPGGADRSYGIEVGRLAGLPPNVIDRARAVLRLLEGEQLAAALAGDVTRADEGVRPAARPEQLGLFGVGSHPALERLRVLDPERMTPFDALQVLDELVRLSRTEGRA